MGRFMKGHIPWSKGRKLNIKHNKQFKKGHSGYWLGKKRDKKTIEKMRIALLKNPVNYWKNKKRNEETKKKISKSLIGRFVGDKHPNWTGGNEFYPLGWTKTFREQIRRKDNYKCQSCGCPEIECNRKLQIHHIDYNKNNLSPNNLISLCINCHMKTNFNRKFWITKLAKKIYV